MATIQWKKEYISFNLSCKKRCRKSALSWLDRAPVLTGAGNCALSSQDRTCFMHLFLHNKWKKWRIFFQCNRPNQKWYDPEGGVVCGCECFWKWVCLCAECLLFFVTPTCSYALDFENMSYDRQAMSSNAHHGLCEIDHLVNISSTV